MNHVAHRCRKHFGPRGFTFIELLLVVAIIALASALVAISLPDSHRVALMRDADRLAALLDSARAESRATGLPIRWRVAASGFAFDGLPPSAPALPTNWLDAQTLAIVNGPVVLGPDPIIPAQSIALTSAAERGLVVRVSTDGLAPFHVETAR